MGRPTRDPVADEDKRQLMLKFPHLEEDRFEITSLASADYNCIAWAAEDTSRWYQPIGDWHWPDGIKKSLGLDAYTQLYERLGYEPCEDGELEKGYEKIAIYADRGIVTHASRSLPNGHWTSKLGQLEDIEHHDLQSLCGPTAYGEVSQFMRRRIQT